VILGGLASAAFLSGAPACVSGSVESCRPQTWLLAVGIVAAIALGVAGALLWKPKPRRPAPRRPWEYPP
jgi:hypothetical protein